MRSLLVASLIAACAAAPSFAQSNPVRPTVVSDSAKVGTYDLEITTDDGTMLGSLSLKRANEALVAELVAGGNRPDIKSFVREKNGYVLTGGHGEFVIVYKLAFAGDSVTGTFSMSTGLAGTVAGVRKR